MDKSKPVHLCGGYFSKLWLHISVGDRQLQKPLLLESLQEHSQGRSRCTQSVANLQGGMTDEVPYVLRSQDRQDPRHEDLNHVLLPLGGRPARWRLHPSGLTNDVFTNAPVEFPHACRHPTRQAHVEQPCDVLGQERRRLAVAASGRVGVAR